MMQNLKQIIESLIFVAEAPLSVDRLKAVLEDVDRRDILLAIAELKGEYEDRHGGFVLQEVAGGLQFRTHADCSEWIKKLLKPSPTRLSRAALETLAIIAYKQPIIRADIEHIRGVDSGGVLRLLLERKLIRVLGRKDIPGRPMIYGTTKDFLELFNLKDLGDLPSPREITSLGLVDSGDDVELEDASQLVVASTGKPTDKDVSTETGGQPDTPPAPPSPEVSSDTPNTIEPYQEDTFAGSGGGQPPMPPPNEETRSVSQGETSSSSQTTDHDPDSRHTLD